MWIEIQWWVHINQIRWYSTYNIECDESEEKKSSFPILLGLTKHTPTAEIATKKIVVAVEVTILLASFTLFHISMLLLYQFLTSIVYLSCSRFHLLTWIENFPVSTRMDDRAWWIEKKKSTTNFTFKNILYVCCIWSISTSNEKMMIWLSSPEIVCAKGLLNDKHRDNVGGMSLM